jgi:hypothetical protein
MTPEAGNINLSTAVTVTVVWHITFTVIYCNLDY